jgi:hypothetical protein
LALIQIRKLFLVMLGVFFPIYPQTLHGITVVATDEMGAITA